MYLGDISGLLSAEVHFDNSRDPFILLSAHLNIHTSLNMADDYSFEYFTVRLPSDHKYVAHVEINRPERLNAFIEV
jgi:hypothetical protein